MMSGLLLIIKHHETLHDSRKHWPYLGYGHRKLPGEKYFRGYKMNEREADALLRKDLNKFIALLPDSNRWTRSFRRVVIQYRAGGCNEKLCLS